MTGMEIMQQVTLSLSHALFLQALVRRILRMRLAVGPRVQVCWIRKLRTFWGLGLYIKGCEISTTAVV
jgi:hypothetical protein